MKIGAGDGRVEAKFDVSFRVLESQLGAALTALNSSIVVLDLSIKPVEKINPVEKSKITIPKNLKPSRPRKAIEIVTEQFDYLETVTRNDLNRILKALHFSKNAASSALNVLLKKGKIVRVEAGVYTKVNTHGDEEGSQV